jgi:hypothetical protein
VAIDVNRHRALSLVAEAPNGCTTRVMLVHGITLDTLVELADDGLVTMKLEHVVGADRSTEVTRVRITDAGRRALS